MSRGAAEDSLRRSAAAKCDENIVLVRAAISGQRRSSMKRITLMWIVLTGALLAPTAGFAQISCSREGLQRAVDLYITAQAKGDTSGLPLTAGLGYMENVAPANINN